MSTLALAWHQARYDTRQFWREPAAVFFTVVLPLIFLVIFASVFGSDPREVDGRRLGGSTYYVPGILTLALVSATFVNLAMTVTIARERGWLKRVRATPVPAGVVLAGQALTALGVAAVGAVLVVGIGALAYGVDVPGDTLPGALLALAVGVLALAALGFAFTALIPSENAASPMTNVVVLPLYFLSGVFIPDDQLPEWMSTVADAFPIKALFEALLTAFDPAQSGPGIEWGALAILAAWGLAGVAAASRWFGWTPRSH